MHRFILVLGTTLHIAACSGESPRTIVDRCATDGLSVGDVVENGAALTIQGTAKDFPDVARLLHCMQKDERLTNVQLHFTSLRSAPPGTHVVVYEAKATLFQE